MSNKSSVKKNTVEEGKNVSGNSVFSVSQDGMKVVVSVDLPSILSTVALLFLALLIWRRFAFLLPKGFAVSEVSLKDPFTGTTTKVKADGAEKVVAHKIWTELVTRKAAIPFQREQDLIVEVYDSWYILFTCIREQIAAVPVEKLKGRQKKDIEFLIDIATSVLNEGLRPHLTQWQAHFRTWYSVALENNAQNLPPQQIQKGFEHYEAIALDIERVNSKLLIFANQLKNLVRA